MYRNINIIISIRLKSLCLYRFLTDHVPTNLETFLIYLNTNIVILIHKFQVALIVRCVKVNFVQCEIRYSKTNLLDLNLEKIVSSFHSHIGRIFSFATFIDYVLAVINLFVWPPQSHCMITSFLSS